MTGWLERALARLDADAIAETTAELVAVESVGGTPGERACLDHVGAWLTERGVPVQRWDLPVADVPAPPGWSFETARDEVAGLTATVGPDDAPGLLVNAHVDVVPAADQAGWTGDPFTARRDGDWLVGRGTADTKGGLAAGMHVAAALAAEARAGGVLPGRLVLSPVLGEEDGGLGTLASVAAGLPVTGAVVLEPTDLRVARATAGALRFRVTVDGLAAHGSVRHRGVSAIDKGWLVHRALAELEGERAARLAHPLVKPEAGAPTPWPICVGRVEGGSHPCDVPDRLVLDGRLGVAPHEDPAAARDDLAEAVARAGEHDAWLADHPPRVDWVGAQWLPSETPAGHALVDAFIDAAESAEAVAVPYGCDAGLLRHVAGLPAVVLGPGGVDAAHAPDERVRVADLGRAAELLLRGAAAWWETAW